MSISDPYASPATYRAVVAKSDTGDDAAILADLTAVSRYLDRRLGRFFTRDAAPVARVYTVPGSLRQPYGSVPVGWAETENPWRYGGWARVLPVDDIAASAGVAIVADTSRDGTFAETPLAATDYELWPRNAALGPEPAPYTTIVLAPNSTQWGFQIGVRVQVTAVWGWPQIPLAVERATCHLAGILRLESPRATSRVNELGEVISTSKQARDIVDGLIEQYCKTASVF